MYVASDSVLSADQLIERIFETSLLLTRRPSISRQRDDLALRLRSYPCGRYLIFYTVTAQTLEVLRVLHGSRDIASLF